MNREREVDKLLDGIEEALKVARKAGAMETRHTALVAIAEKAEKAMKLNVNSHRWRGQVQP
jgi:hypothetical protein